MPRQPDAAVWPAGAGRPAPRVLVATCLWALGLAVAGAAVGVAALFVLAGDPPTWYPPAVVIAGLVGIATTATALGLVGIARLRWPMLGAGTAALVVAAVLTLAAG